MSCEEWKEITPERYAGPGPFRALKEIIRRYGFVKELVKMGRR